MVTATDRRDAEIFGQISALMAKVSVKNKKNLNDLMATYQFQRSWTDEVERVFERAAGCDMDFIPVRDLFRGRYGSSQAQEQGNGGTGPDYGCRA